MKNLNYSKFKKKIDNQISEMENLTITNFNNWHQEMKPPQNLGENFTN